jgi:hypothetical protein
VEELDALNQRVIIYPKFHCGLNGSGTAQGFTHEKTSPTHL